MAEIRHFNSSFYVYMGNQNFNERFYKFVITKRYIGDKNKEL